MQNTYNFVVEMNELFLCGGGARVPLAFRVPRECGSWKRMKGVLRLVDEPSTAGRLRVVQRSHRRLGVQPLKRVQLLHYIHDAEIAEF